MAIFDIPLDRLRERQSMKWRAHDSDVLPAWVAEMDCLPAEPIRRRLAQALESGDTGYPHGDGYERALLAYAQRHWDWTFDPATQVVHASDVMQGVAAVLERFTPTGSQVLVNPPVYNFFYKALPGIDRSPLDVPVTAEGRLDLPAIERAVTKHRPAAYLLSSPHNPHGTVHTREELTEVARICAAHDVLLVSDEIHAPLVSAPARHTPLLAVEGVRRAVVILSASKAWNLAGLKAALVIASPDLADDIRGLPITITHGAGHLALLARTTALAEGQPWLEGAMAEIEANRRLLGELLTEHVPGAIYHPGEATYLAWVDCSALGLDEPQATFLEQGRVAVSRGADFGPGGQQCVRVNLATSPEVLTEVVRRMGAALRA